jgi:hypothetical protein
MNGESKSSITYIFNHHFLKHLPKIMLFPLLIFLVACSQPRTRRGAPPGGGMTLPQYAPEELLASMRDRLNLTDEQQKKVRPIMEEYCKKQQDIIGKYKGQEPHGGDCCLRCELQRLEESIEKQLATFLTEKQMREYQKIQDELQPRSPEKNGPQGMDKGGPGGRGGWGGGMGGGMPPGM